MSPSYSSRGESERILRFAQELSSRLGGTLKDMIPPDAQHHLQNAQRELLTALFLIYEHQAGARRPPAVKPRRSRPANKRLSKIDID